MTNRVLLAVKDIIQETADAVTIQFCHPLAKRLLYQPGQFLTFLLQINKQIVRRSYALSSSPHADRLLAITVKRLEGGLVSNYLCDQVKEGDVLETLEPQGRFVPKLDKAHHRTYVLIGAGSGIAPLFSIVKSILVCEPFSRVWLIYSNQSGQSIIFKTPLQDLERAYGSFHIHTTHVLSQPARGFRGQVGYLHERTLIDLLVAIPAEERKESLFYICAPEEIMRQTCSALALFWIPSSQVFTQSYLPH